MPAKPSSEVRQAMALIKQGHSAYAAARQVGIALSTIYRSRLYREWRDAKKEKPPRPRNG